MVRHKTRTSMFKYFGNQIFPVKLGSKIKHLFRCNQTSYLWTLRVPVIASTPTSPLMYTTCSINCIHQDFLCFMMPLQLSFIQLQTVLVLVLLMSTNLDRTNCSPSTERAGCRSLPKLVGSFRWPWVRSASSPVFSSTKRFSTISFSNKWAKQETQRKMWSKRWNKEFHMKLYSSFMIPLQRWKKDINHKSYC